MVWARRPVVIANEIRMQRSQHSGPFVVVEGRDDRLFYLQQVNPRSCHIKVAEGRAHVEDVIHILDDDGFEGTVGFIDNDFDVLEGQDLPSTNLIRSDYHDLECLLLESPALDCLLVEFGSAPKIEACEEDVRALLLKAASHLGYLRWLSHRNGYGLKFDGLSLRACVDSRDLTVDAPELVRRVRNLSTGHVPSAGVLEDGVEQLAQEEHDLWHVCSGADLIKILSIALTQKLGSNRHSIVTPDKLRSALRLAYTHQDFRSSTVHAGVLEWEERNGSFRLME